MTKTLGIFKCYDCSKKFRSESALLSHEMFIHGKFLGNCKTNNDAKQLAKSWFIHGKSQAVIIPRTIAKKLNLNGNEIFEFTTNKDNQIILTPFQPNKKQMRVLTV